MRWVATGQWGGLALILPYPDARMQGNQSEDCYWMAVWAVAVSSATLDFWGPTRICEWFVYIARYFHSSIVCCSIPSGMNVDLFNNSSIRKKRNKLSFKWQAISISTNYEREGLTTQLTESFPRFGCVHLEIAFDPIYTETKLEY